MSNKEKQTESNLDIQLDQSDKFPYCLTGSVDEQGLARRNSLHMVGTRAPCRVSFENNRTIGLSYQSIKDSY